MSKKLKLWEGSVSFARGYDTKYMLYTFDYSSQSIKIINYIFYHELEFQDFERGRSSVVANFISLDKSLRASMFISDVGEIINRNIGLKVLKGYFCFTKKGSNYGIKYLGDTPPDSNLMVGEFDLDKYIKVDNE